jgi:two-component system chemotaxis sensor kinase CheA
VVISVADDGRGVDRQKIVRVALERGLLEESAVATLSPRELLGLVFVPGFSTAKDASLLSGRGVGLDVVKTDVARLSGFIDLESEPGVGTTVRMTLPVTLALLQGLIVEVCKRRYAVPVNAVWEVLPKGMMGAMKRREMVVPVVRLAELFALDGNAESQERFVVVVGPGENKIGLAVDDVRGHQALIIKPLSMVLGPVRGIGGLSLLNTGTPLLVLDVGALVDEASAIFGATASRAMRVVSAG